MFNPKTGFVRLGRVEPAIYGLCYAVFLTHRLPMWLYLTVLTRQGKVVSSGAPIDVTAYKAKWVKIPFLYPGKAVFHGFP